MSVDRKLVSGSVLSIMPAKGTVVIRTKTHGGDPTELRWRFHVLGVVLHKDRDGDWHTEVEPVIMTPNSNYFTTLSDLTASGASWDIEMD